MRRFYPMIPTLGHWLILLAIGACLFNVGATVFAYRAADRNKWLEVAHNAAFASWALVASACALLITAFLTDNFGLAYVFQNSSRAQPIPFKISALWGGQGGSLLLWTFVLACYGWAVSAGGRRSGSELSPAATSVICATTLFFAGLVAFMANPFTVIDGAVPADGNGMNPLLQNYWMQIHPPTLYTGYVGCTVPFAFAVSALLHRRFDAQWVAVIRKWVLFTWIILTVGIVLGGVWAYETLGWGGYWAWDPVENASLMPWLAATAFLHSIMLQARRGLLKNWNIALVTLTFLLSVFGTFLTRSGVIQNSVHAFTESGSGIGPALLWFICLALVSTAILIWARRDELASPAHIDNPLSREGVFMLNNLLLLAATAAVLYGTVYPTLAGAFGNSQVVVDKSYFNSVMPPIGLALLALTGIGPLLPWRNATWKSVWKAIKYPALWAIAFAPLLWFLADWRTGAATAFTLAFFVALAIGWEFWRGVKTLMHKRGESALDASANLVSFNPARYGGYIVHLGVALMFVGLTGSSIFKIELDPITLKPGETMSLGEYTLKFETLARPAPMPQNLKDQVVALVSVWDKNGRVTPENRPMDPRIDFFKNATANNPAAMAGQEGQTAKRPSIRSTPANDVYLVLAGYDTKDGSAAIKAYLNPLVMWIWISVGFFVLGTIVAMIPARRGRVVEPTPVETEAESNPALPRELVAR